MGSDKRFGTAASCSAIHLSTLSLADATRCCCGPALLISMSICTAARQTSNTTSNDYTDYQRHELFRLRKQHKRDEASVRADFNHNKKTSSSLYVK